MASLRNLGRGSIQNASTWVCVGLLTIPFIFTSASAQSIQVYTDLAGTVCTGNTIDGFIQGSVWANLDGPAAEGITGAEFRIDATLGSSGDYFYDYNGTYAADAPIALGNLFVNRYHDDSDSYGINLAFFDCQTNARVRLLTFTVVLGYYWREGGIPTNVRLNVRRHARGSEYCPAVQPFACPLLTLCDGPVFTKVCVIEPSDCQWWNAPIHTYAVLDPNPGESHDCLNETNRVPTGVSESNWGAVKSLYR